MDYWIDLWMDGWMAGQIDDQIGSQMSVYGWEDIKIGITPCNAQSNKSQQKSLC